jgi:hypothetical protein
MLLSTRLQQLCDMLPRDGSDTVKYKRWSVLATSAYLRPVPACFPADSFTDHTTTFDDGAFYIKATISHSHLRR